MKILITGSSGYLGHQLSKIYSQMGNEIIGIDLKPSELKDPKFREILCDITDEGKIKDILRSTHPEIIIHCAAALAQFVPDEKIMHKINVDGTRYLLEVAFETQVKWFIFLSSVEVYGIKVPIPCPETAPNNPICQYGRDKIECEQICRDFSQKGLSITIFRPPTITGPGQNEPTLLNQFKSAYLGKTILLPGGGKSRLQMVNVGDVGQAILLAIDNPKARGEIFNLGSDNVPTLEETALALYKYAGKKAKTISIPAGILRFLVKLLDKLHASPIAPQHLEIALKDYMFSNQKVKDFLGWKPTKTDIESAYDTYDWYIRKVGDHR